MKSTNLIVEDNELEKLADENWTQNAANDVNDDVITKIYTSYLLLELGVSNSNCKTLELSGYLEKYLWSGFNPSKLSKEHMFSIILMINEKFSQDNFAWGILKTRSEEDFRKFMLELVDLKCLKQQTMKLSFQEESAYLAFLVNVFRSLEEPMVSKIALKLVSLPLWNAVSTCRREREFKKYPKLRRHWNNAKVPCTKDDSLTPKKKRRKSSSIDSQTLDNLESKFFPNLLISFLRIVDNFGEVPEEERKFVMVYFNHFMELIIDLLCQLPTRRFLKVLLFDYHTLVRCKTSACNSLGGSFDELRIFNQQCKKLEFYLNFDINDQTGLPMSRREVLDNHYSKVHLAQRLAFKYFPEKMKAFSLCSIGELSSNEGLKEVLENVEVDTLLSFGEKLGLVPLDIKERQNRKLDNPSWEFILEVYSEEFSRRTSQVDYINNISLYPAETVLWDPSLVPLARHVRANTHHVYAIPKLNLQYLTFIDYLLRNFELYRLESAHSIRDDISLVVKEVLPRKDAKNRSVFRGYSTMALPVTSFSLTKVEKPKAGETKPSSVVAEVKYQLDSFKHKDQQVMTAWDSLKLHDVVFLISINPVIDEVSEELGHYKASYLQRLKDLSSLDTEEAIMNFPEDHGILSVRGGEILDVLDESENSINDWNRNDRSTMGTKRTLRISLDPSQYQQDMANGSDAYETINLVVRRNPKQNNFKAVLETIRDLINLPSIETVIPKWLQDVLLGYGDPASAHYTSLLTPIDSMRFVDTFLDFGHLVDSFPGATVKTAGDIVNIKNNGDCKLNFSDGLKGMIEVTTSRHSSRLLKSSQRKTNDIRFTPTQVEAIYSGMKNGLSVVVGPPGTGKTDVAVQIIMNLYHNNPKERIVVVTHANQALNDIFGKLLKSNVEERHLLRLGSGEKELKTLGDYSKVGRVNYALTRRLELLQEVEKIATELEGDSQGVAYTCENADYYYKYVVLPKLDIFMNNCKIYEKEGVKLQNYVKKEFPLISYFSSINKDLFSKSITEDLEECCSHVHNLFKELQDYRAFELLRNQRQRADYLIMKQARIIAMTCTHAAIARRRLIELDFQYHSLIMEESAQIMEIETFIPLLLQAKDSKENSSRLKRVVLIGDHMQLPPVVKNTSIQKYSHFDMSMFTRFIRLGVPYTTLKEQGRTRPSIAEYYTWRYKNLENLPHITTREEFSLANPGFAYTSQLVDIPDCSEELPKPYCFQNPDEAMYIVLVFQYMRSLGYPADKISVLTTYKGQKQLLRRMFNQASKDDPFYGVPCNISTVDRFQGQQNEYVLLSLVRTKTVGYLRDIRRLIVSLSRARLGLYVFCRKQTFMNCYELDTVFKMFEKYPSNLHVIPTEPFLSKRKEGDIPEDVSVVNNFAQLQKIVTSLRRT